ncbi:MAG TPA: 16S rRNA (cytosine(1402)-N(4))-methyltransferase, partial [Kutzneria sp.]|nr:16S rRNA (cytosine(1402)-N(4))-methyltransferase [Kutzneria sp.]
GHPAKRTFQALRIEVNGELEVLRRAVPAALSALAVGGRIVVESYHSLEDRLVKRALTELSVSTTPLDLPVELPGHGPELKLVTRGAEVAGEQEIADNPRSASVRLRAAERIRRAS